MSRVSLNRRLEAVLVAAERVDPLAARVHRLPPALRQRYDAWRAECAVIYARYKGSEGGVYEAYLAGELVTPNPPRAVAEALELNSEPVLLKSMSVDDLAKIYAARLEK